MRLRIFCLLALLSTTALHAQEPWPGDSEMADEEIMQVQASQIAMQSYYKRIATELVAGGGPRGLAFAGTLLLNWPSPSGNGR